MKLFYRLMIKCYPKKFRDLFHGEIERVLEEYLETEYRRSEGVKKNSLYFLHVIITFFKMIPWIIKEHYYYFISDFPDTPTILKISYGIHLLLLSPFFIIVLHNLLQLILWHSAYLAMGTTTFWEIIGIVFPCISLFISISLLTWVSLHQMESIKKVFIRLPRILLPTGSISLTCVACSIALLELF